MQRIIKRSERGDTLIEVLIAIASLSLIVTICYSVMTRGFAQGQIALERTTTQGMVSGQIATLRDIFSRHELLKQKGNEDPDWQKIVDVDGYSNSIDPDTLNTSLQSARLACSLGTANHKAFYFDPNAPTPTTPKSFILTESGVHRVGSAPAYGDGMWIEAYKVDASGDDARPYYIFFVKTCWDASISGEEQSMVMNVRFYETYN